MTDYWLSPVGWLAIHCSDAELLRIEWASSPPTAIQPPRGLAQTTIEQLDAYFRNPDHRFELPLAPAATEFRQRVRQLLQQIPAGHSRTYGDAAQQLGSIARAVGQACRTNPLPIIVPCHRIVAATGLGGFNGQTSGHFLDHKSWLLSHEQRR